MWCQRCQQDVPAVAMMSDSKVVCCARCGNPVPRQGDSEIPAALRDAQREVSTDERADTSQWNYIGPVPLDDSRLDDDLWEAERLALRAQRQCSLPAASAMQEAFDATPLPSAHDKRRRRRPARPRQGGSPLGWTIAGLGLSGLVCGCALAGWSLLGERPELWSIGLPVALVSQVVLAVGLMLQFDAGKTDGVAHAESDDEEDRSVTHLHVHAGGMQPQGVSVHYGGSSQGQQSAQLTPRQIQGEIEAALRRRAA